MNWNLNGMRSDSPWHCIAICMAIHILDRNTGLLEWAAAGSWSLGIMEQSQGGDAIDCGETDQGEVREEIMVGNAGGGKPGSRGSKVILLSHM